MKHKTIIPLGRFLRTARENMGLTLRSVEKATGVSNAYLSQIESGKIQQPSPVVLNKLCNLYEVSYAAAMKLAGYPMPNDSDSIFAKSRSDSRIGSITPDEEEALLEYLEFLRSKRSGSKLK